MDCHKRNIMGHKNSLVFSHAMAVIAIIAAVLFIGGGKMSGLVLIAILVWVVNFILFCNRVYNNV